MANSVAKRGDLSRFVGFSTNLGGAIFQGGDFLKIVKCDFSVYKYLLNDIFHDEQSFFHKNYVFVTISK